MAESSGFASMTPSVDRYDDCQVIPSRNLRIFDPPHFHPSAITPGLCTRERADVQGGVRGIGARGVGVSDHEGIGLTRRGYSQSTDRSHIAVGGEVSGLHDPECRRSRLAGR